MKPMHLHSDLSHTPTNPCHTVHGSLNTCCIREPRFSSPVFFHPPRGSLDALWRVTPSRTDPALPDASWGSWRLESGSSWEGGASLWNRWEAGHGVGMCAEKVRQSRAGVVLGGFQDRELIYWKIIQVRGKGGLSSSHIERDWGSSGNSQSFQGPKSVT